MLDLIAAQIEVVTDSLYFTT